MFQLKRVTEQAILSPIPQHEWEKTAVFNTGAIAENGLVHLLYRATDNVCDGKHGEYTSSIGYAVSRNGVDFSRLDLPVMVGEGAQESWGVEDPRITKIDDTFYMVYTGYGARFKGDFRMSLATSKNLLTWENRRVLLDEPNKDGALFSRKVNGKYLLLHRRMPAIWLCESENLYDFDNHKVIMEPIPNSWESEKIGAAGPPIEREDSWLLFYHAVDRHKVYRLGAALLDKQDPSKVLARLKEPIFEPELTWEKEGCVPNVVFSGGQVELNDTYYVYYGGADTAIGVAAIAKKDVVF
ncbi:glycosidase [Neobacillus sp. MM2021_6]|uniref:glycoside hydrolase family 130 protein n=1 Tax=Bacillaceae TaxID=186817 RepID=UPI00140B3198|nr:MULTISPECIES: glycosidase [Bacillaceae]MBO0959903.1 glycosidase [Neobacillus sp. MM2021_6]NHC18851.1 glycosidase [Bacillus sp. MM2020_4]